MSLKDPRGGPRGVGARGGCSYAQEGERLHQGIGVDGVEPAATKTEAADDAGATHTATDRTARVQAV